MRHVTCLTLALLSLTTVAHAATIATPSLEWLADHCIDSGIYTVSAIDEKSLSFDARVTLSLKKGLRGKPAPEIEQDYHITRLSNPSRALVAMGDEFLICFQHFDSGRKRVVQVINLDNPQIKGYPMIAVSCDLKILKSKEEILKVFEGRLQSHADGDPVEITDFSKDNRFELSPTSEVFPAVWDGSSSYLRVPADLVERVRAASSLQEQEAATRAASSESKRQ